MVRETHVLNSRDVKRINETLNKQFGAGFDAKKYTFLENKKGKLYIVNREVFDLPLEKFRIDSIGLHVASRMIDGWRLSIEGSQLLGKDAKHHVLELADEEVSQWLKGEDIARDLETGFYLIKHKNDYLGTAKIKEGKVNNYFPKARRLVNVNA